MREVAPKQARRPDLTVPRHFVAHVLAGSAHHLRGAQYAIEIGGVAIEFGQEFSHQRGGQQRLGNDFVAHP